MKAVLGCLKNQSVITTCAVLTVALFTMAPLLSNFTAPASYPAQDPPVAPSPKEPSLPLRDIIAEKLKTQDKVKLDLLVMSQCPFGVKAEQALAPILEEFGDKIDFTLYFIASEDNKGGFRSLHGQPEVAEDIRQVVMARYYPDKYFDYVVARAGNYQSGWEQQAAALGINPAKVNEIASGTEGEALFRENIKKGKELGIGASPTLLIDDEKYTGRIFSRPAASAGCQAGPSAPKEDTRMAPLAKEPNSPLRDVSLEKLKTQVSCSSSDSEDSVEIAGKIYCLVRGDLLYHPYLGPYGHIGIYSGNRKFVDAYPGQGVKIEQSITGSYQFDNTYTKCYRVETTRANRIAAVAWAESKNGQGFEELYGCVNCTDYTSIWYCSELVYCAYWKQDVILGELTGGCWIKPASIIADSDVVQVSSKSPGSVSSTDSNGNAKNCFLTSETVYAKGSGFCGPSNYNIYICSHPVSNGASLSGCPYSSSVNTASNGYFTPQPKSLWTFAVGDYDIVVDENGDGEYDSGIDAIDSSVAVHECCANEDCDDGNECTTDSCSNGSCDNTLQCTSHEDCDDGDPCSDDYCFDGCCYNTPECPPDVFCDDGDPCTYDYCIDGCCYHEPECTTHGDCDDGNPCTLDLCFVGCCFNEPDCYTDADCDDGDPDTDDSCDAGGCCHNEPTVVTLASFTATSYDGYVLAEWETASEVDTEGFNIWRSQAVDGQYIKLNAAFISAQGDIIGASYTYTDTAVINGVTYYYKLEDVDTHGTSAFYGPVSARPSRVFRIFLPLVVKRQ